jgi:hypothetical protein
LGIVSDKARPGFVALMSACDIPPTPTLPHKEGGLSEDLSPRRMSASWGTKARVGNRAHLTVIPAFHQHDVALLGNRNAHSLCRRFATSTLGFRQPMMINPKSRMLGRPPSWLAGVLSRERKATMCLACARALLAGVHSRSKRRQFGVHTWVGGWRGEYERVDRLAEVNLAAEWNLRRSAGRLGAREWCLRIDIEGSGF